MTIGEAEVCCYWSIHRTCMKLLGEADFVLEGVSNTSHVAFKALSGQMEVIFSHRCCQDLSL